MKAGHTPAPWAIQNTSIGGEPLPPHHWEVVAESGRHICCFGRLIDGAQEQQAADARLIVAAPDLLDALDTAISAHERGVILTGSEVQQLRAIAEKATGGKG